MATFTRPDNTFRAMLRADERYAHSGDLPPVIAGLTGTETKMVSRWRWWMHLFLLGALPLAIGVLGILGRGKAKAMLPPTVSGLLRISLAEAGYFAVIFLIAWLFSRVNGAQLLLSWRGRALPILLGFAYSFALRAWRLMVVMLPHRASYNVDFPHRHERTAASETAGAHGAFAGRHNPRSQPPLSRAVPHVVELCGRRLAGGTMARGHVRRVQGAVSPAMLGPARATRRSCS